MKLSAKTVQILDNFSSINPSIYFKNGNVIKTRSLAKNLFASATIDETFPKNFAVYDLTRFLNVVALFDDPVLEFDKDDDAVLIGDGKNHVRYVYTNPIIVEDVVVNPEGYDKTPNLPATVVEFRLQQEDMAKVLKAAKVLVLPNITIKGDKGNLKIVAEDTSNPSSDSYELDIGSTDETFSVHFKIETMKMVPGTYDVTITERQVCKFVNTASTISYLVGAEVKRS